MVGKRKRKQWRIGADEWREDEWRVGEDEWREGEDD
jgi:hypothetical protein